MSRHQEALICFLLALAPGSAQILPHRWVFVTRGLQSDRDVEDIRQIAKTASEHGLNGMVLSAGLTRLDLQPAAYFRRLDEVKKIMAEQSLELVPLGFSAGYGGDVLAHNRNLAEGLPVKDALFVVRDGVARLEPDPAVSVVNGGFEEYTGQTMRGYNFHDRPGEVSFPDTQVFHAGKASLRFENFQNYPAGNARVMQEVAVKPYRCYRVSAWLKAEGLGGTPRIQILATDGRTMAPVSFEAPATSDWRKLTLGVNSTKEARIRIYVGVWGGRGGKFWVDDLEIEEVGLTNIVRRPGAPLAVRSEDKDAVYEENADFDPVRDPALTFRFDHDAPSIRLRAGSRIGEGERLRVSYHHGVSINDGQVTVCMSEPELYEIWSKQARLIQDTLAPRRWLLSMDEIRAGGTDESCRRREMTMAQILGDAVTRQYNLIKEVNPEAEVMIWSDMLDPNHNARANYYLVDGDYTGSWEYVPKELIIVCWYYDRRKESLRHFSELGFRTFAAAYYDGDTLDNPRGWLEELDKTEGAIGIMYTTWQNKYELLGPFGDLVRNR
ncbi:MAG: hypothetical protein HY235_08600 [Acidobacteria bacterium]|nr:hypothetical protein [Acidobacteriota bacterium]